MGSEHIYLFIYLGNNCDKVTGMKISMWQIKSCRFNHRDNCRKDYRNKEYLREHVRTVHGGMNSCSSYFSFRIYLNTLWGMGGWIFISVLGGGYNFNNELFELLLLQVWFTGTKERETEKSYGGCSQGKDYQRDKCNFSSLLNFNEKWGECR